jgi:hypothetical protein
MSKNGLIEARAEAEILGGFCVLGGETFEV